MDEPQQQSQQESACDAFIKTVLKTYGDATRGAVIAAAVTGHGPVDVLKAIILEVGRFMAGYEVQADDEQWNAAVSRWIDDIGKAAISYRALAKQKAPQLFSPNTAAPPSSQAPPVH